MPLSAIQKGVVGQLAFVTAALVTGRGQVEVYTPAADNEGRDAEVRRHLNRLAGVGIQVKISFGLHPVNKGRPRTYLTLRFELPRERVSNDPRLWYFLAVYDPKQLRLLDTVFLVPSRMMHRLGRHGYGRKGLEFHVMANMIPASRDKWSPYRVGLGDLGKRLLEIIDDAPLTKTSGASKLPSDSVLVGRVNRSARSARLKRAA